ncbi:MAG: hypothetical protein UY76_C0062G0006 [Candidatus Uhrbacteria bacterium GW2011_GWA2_52_8d]|uniref:Glycerophosphoryl diester phosphodiesterase membrane domain-containing protein n=1 Tax=Candidatus Uhrbacteria bacterium GW2011_GWA2_52_8d TaxID=1618979 RepID=A0A0G1XK62_9BACT|nr:MAG: hypothetical protein UY76_C0062G0006 [Candidatus Uhrbacteria bacterium GW2011_GWA2_52_8d]
MLINPRELLRNTVCLYRAEFWMYVGYTAWLVVPTAAFYFASALPRGLATTVLIVLSILAQVFISLWMVVCIMRSTHMLASGQKIDLQKISQEAVRRIQPVLVVAFVQALIILGGVLMLIIPGILFWGWYAFAQLSAAIDDQRPIAALSASRALVQGRFFPVLWRLLAGPIVIGLLYAFILGFVLLFLSNLFGQDASLVFSETPPLWAQLIEVVADVFVIPLLVIYSVLLYGNLKTTALEKVGPVT